MTIDAHFLVRGDACEADRSRGPSVLAAAATGIVPFIERHKGDIDRIFGYAGLAPELAGSPTLKFSLNSFCRLFEFGSTVTRDDNFGLWFGNQFEPRDLGLYGYAAISSPTVGAALNTLVELFPLHQEQSTMRLAVDACGLMRLEYRIECPDIIERRQDAELSLGCWLNIMREGLGKSWAPAEVHFEHPGPECAREHQRAFSAPVFFSQPTNALLFERSVLDQPMPAKDVRLLMAMRQCMMQLNERRNQVTITDLVRSTVRARLPDGWPELETIAADVRLPLSTIHRELRRDGTSYRDLVEQTRHDLALSYMRQRQLRISEIAAMLGYSELSAFSRAVRRWTGLSPRSLREQLLGERIA